ncbi:MAG: hypothetical protein CR963_00875, partial [Gammaproteobacteria bacterium]
PTSIKIVGGTQDGKRLAVKGEGVWTVNDGSDPDKPAGTITFKPNKTFKGEPSPIEYTIQNNEGDTSEPTQVEVHYGPIVSITGIEEVNEAVGDVEYTIHLDKPVDVDTVVTVEVTNKEEGRSKDPTEDPDTNGTRTIKITIPAGKTTGTIKVNVEDDNPYEGAEDYNIEITDVEAIIQQDDEEINIARIVDKEDKDIIGSSEVETTIYDDGSGTTDGRDPEDPNNHTDPSDPNSPLKDPIDPLPRVNDDTAPKSVEDQNTTPEDTPVSGNVLDNDKSPDGSDLSVKDFAIDTDGDGIVDKTYQPGETADIKDPEGKPVGTLVIEENGDYTFTPEPNFNGDVPAIEYTAQDEDGNVDPTKVILKVTPVADDPIADKDTANTPKNTPVSIKVTDNDSDPDGDLDPTTVKLIDPDTKQPVDEVTIPNEGTYKVDPEGKVTFTPDPAFIGESTVDYVVSDEEGNKSDPTPIKITVAEGNPPVAEDDTDTTKQDEPVTGNV